MHCWGGDWMSSNLIQHDGGDQRLLLFSNSLENLDRNGSLRSRSHRAVPTPSVGISGCNSEKSGGPAFIS